ncbi:MAG: hypothetical protein O2967_10935 [Proteobacteria bacterium]|nr:hypothetical protein [Pseudomonadota bacterium]
MKCALCSGVIREMSFAAHCAYAAALDYDGLEVAAMADRIATAKLGEETPEALIDKWLPSGHVAHIQVNDGNGRGPGQGGDHFAPVLSALRRHNYTGTIAVELFEYYFDGPASAARAIGYLRGTEEALHV